MKSLKDLKRHNKVSVENGQHYYRYFKCSDIEAIMPKWVSVDVLPEKHGWYYCSVDGDTENSYDTYYGPMYNDDTKIGWEGEITYWLDNVPPAPEMKDEE